MRIENMVRNGKMNETAMENQGYNAIHIGTTGGGARGYTYDFGTTFPANPIRDYDGPTMDPPERRGGNWVQVPVEEGSGGRAEELRGGTIISTLLRYRFTASLLGFGVFAEGILLLMVK